MSRFPIYSIVTLARAIEHKTATKTVAISAGTRGVIDRRSELRRTVVLMTDSLTLIVPDEHVWELPPYPMRTWLGANLQGRYTIEDKILESDFDVERRIIFQNKADMILFQSVWGGEVVDD